LISPSLPVIVPDPVPDFATVKLYTVVAKVAVTDFAAFIVAVQVLVPEHPPLDQPVKVYPLFGEAVNVTDVPGL
jgi:hypothetical protein